MSFFAPKGVSIKWNNTELPHAALGQLVVEQDTIFRYVRASTAVTAGEVVIGETAYSTNANITGFSNVGDRALGRFPYVEDSAWAMTAGDYTGGFMYISGGTGVGQMKRIRSNTDTKVYFEALHPRLGDGEADTLATDPDTTSDITLICPWHVKESTASAILETVVGYAPQALTADYYGWVVCYGIGIPKMGGTGVIDTLVIPGDDTAGQGTIAATTHDLGDATPFGITLFAGADDTTWPVWMRCSL